MSKKSSKTDILNSASKLGLGAMTPKDKLGLVTLEPRVLLDAAAVATGAEMALDVMAQDGAQEAANNIFEAPEAELNWIAQYDGLAALTNEKTESPLQAVDDGNFEIHSGETINVDLRANDIGDGQIVGIVDPAAPSEVITLTANQSYELASGLGVELLADGSFNVTGPSSPDAPSVSFDYVIEDEAGIQSQATATFDWPVPPVANDDGEVTPIAITGNTALNIDVLANDTDADGDSLTITAIIDPVDPAAVIAITVGDVVELSSGTQIELLASGELQVTTTPLGVGLESFAYEISDGAETSQANVTLERSQGSLISVPSSVIGSEDNPIPIPVSVDPALLSGGDLPDIVGTSIGFRDAADGTAPSLFTIPPNVTSISITASGGNENGSNAGLHEEFIFSVITVDLTNGTFSGHDFVSVGFSQRTSDNFAFTDVPLGDAASTGLVAGERGQNYNDFTVDVIDGQLSVSSTNTFADIVYLVEFQTSDGSSSNLLEIFGDVQTPAEVTSSFNVGTDAEFAIINLQGGRDSNDNREEDKVLGRLVVDYDTGLVSGSIFSQTGRGADHTVAFAFEGYDLSSGLPILDPNSGATIIGDPAGFVQNVHDLIITQSGDDLTVTRPSGVTNAFEILLSVETYDRVDAGSAAFVLGSEAVSFTHIQNPNRLTTFDFPVAQGAETANITLALSVVGFTTANADNENTATARLVVDFENETVSGTFITTRAQSPDLISFTNVPFGTRLFDHPDTISNHATIADFTDEIAAVLQFDLVTNADGSVVLQGTAQVEPGADIGTFANYAVVGQAVFTGRLPIEISGFSAGGQFNLGSLNPETGNWEVNAEDLPNLEFIPNEHFSGNTQALVFDYRGDSQAVNVDVIRVADAPSLATTDFTFLENTAIEIPNAVLASLVDQDGSETLSVELDNIPVGHTITDGVNSFTATAGNQSVDITAWNVAALRYAVSAGDVGEFVIDVRASASDVDGFTPTADIAQTLGSFTLTVLADTDGDSVADIDDIDDDNDGILDVDEDLEITFTALTSTLGNFDGASVFDATPITSRAGTSFSDFDMGETFPGGPLLTTDPGSIGEQRSFTVDFPDGIDGVVHLAALNVDFHTLSIFDQDGNPVNVTIVDASDDTQVSGNTISDRDPNSFTNGDSASGIFRLEGSFTSLQIVREVLIPGSTDGFVISFAQLLAGRDTDNDGIVDHLDIDSDNDGITDNIEGQSTADYIAPNADDAGTYAQNLGLNSAYANFSAIDFSDVANLTVGTPAIIDTITIGDTDVDISANFISSVSGESRGDDQGNLILGDGENQDVPDPATGDALELSFSAPSIAVFTQETGQGLFNSVSTTSGDLIRLETAGGFIVNDPDGDLNIVSNDGDVLVFGVAGDSVILTSSNFTILTNQRVSTINVQVDGDTLSPINIALLDIARPVDTDSDGEADFIDTNSDNEGAGDTVEAGLTGTATGLSNASTDADGDGLFDVFDTQNGTTDNDGFNVNESLDAGAAALPDADGDASGGVPLEQDVDFRDAENFTPPVAQDDVFEIHENPEGAEIGVIANGSLLADNGGNGVDSDVNGDALSITQINGVDISDGEQITLASGALLTIRTDGTFDYDPNGAFDFLDTGETITETFSYTLSDGTIAPTDTATVTITISGDNDLPVLDLNGPDELGTNVNGEFVEDTEGLSIARLLSIDAVIEDDEDNISQIEITPNLPEVNDSDSEFIVIETDDISLSIRLSDGQINAELPLTFGETQFDISYDDGAIIITNAQGGSIESDDLEGFLRLLSYRNTSQDAIIGPREFTFEITDPEGVSVGISTITVRSINDAPVPTIAPNSNGTVAELGSEMTAEPILIVTPESAALSDALTEAEVLERLNAGESAADLGLISVSDLLAQLEITDAEQTAFGIGIISADESEGVWQYLRTDIDGHEWTDFQSENPEDSFVEADPDNSDATPVPEGRVILLDANTVLRFIPDAGFSGGAGLSFRVWDGTVGEASNPPSTIADDSGGAAPFSTSSLSTTAFGISLAADTDGDGVINANDVDDDNDGILDVNESLGGTTIGQFQQDIVDVDTDGVTGFSTSVAALDGQEVTTGVTPGFVDGTRTDLLGVGDVIAVSVNGGTQIIAYTINDLSAGAEINYRLRDPGGNPNFELRGVDDADEQQVDFTVQFFNANDTDFSGDLGNIAQIIAAGGGVPIPTTTSIRISDIDLDGRTEGVAANIDDLASYTIEGNNGSFAPVTENGFVVFRGTTVDPSDNVQLNYLNADNINVRFLNDDDGRAGFSFNFSQFNFNTPLTTTTGLDSDGDGIADHLDIDSDDDGITDNIEAQSTDGYIAPSGTGNPNLGGDFLDVNRDGFDDNYDTRNGSLTASSAAATAAESVITPQDTDGLGSPDHLDPDSDDDGILDVDESGLGVIYAAGDTDGDGLADVFEAALDGNVNDGFVINEGIAPLDGTLGDTDSDTDGTITPLVNDLDFRDVPTPPIAQNNAQTTDENSTVSGNAITNIDAADGADDAVDGDSLTLTQINGVAISSGDVITLPSGALLTINADGSYDYNPNGQFDNLAFGASASDSFSYTIDDGFGGTDSASVTLTINGVNDAPIAQDDAEMVNENTMLSENLLLDNGNGADSDAEGDSLTVTQINGAAFVSGTSITLPSGALLTVNDDGSYDYDPNGQFDGLQLGQTATDSFDYTISDGNGGSDTASVTITISGLNDAPNAADDAERIDADSALSDNVLLANGNGLDTDPEGDALFVSAVNGDAANIGTAITLPSGALVTVNADGSYDYDPNGQFETLGAGQSATDSFDYTISDGNGGTDTATVTITIDGVNAPPVAQNDFEQAGATTAIAENVLTDNGNGADSDIDGDSLTVTLINGASFVSGGQITLPSGALLTISSDGSYIYNPNGQFESLALGESFIDSYEYTISDGQGGSATASVFVTILGINNLPDAVDDIERIDADSTLSDNVFLANGNGFDTDPDGDSLSVGAVNGQAANVGTQITLASGALLTVNADGSYDYDPNGQFDTLGAGDMAMDSFSYTVSDGNGGTDTATVFITIDGVNTPPVAFNDSFTGDEDTPLTGSVFANNGGGFDDDLNNDFILVSQVGGFAANVGVPVTGSGGGLFTINANGDIAFNPNSDFEALDAGESAITTVSYQITDGEGGFDTATVIVTVTGANDAPVVTGTLTPQAGIDGAAQLPFDASTVFSDVDGESLNFTSPDLPSWMSLNPVTGLIIGTPPADASQGGPNADGTYVVTLVATDPDGASVSTTLTYTFTNPRPVVDTPIGAIEALDNESLSITPNIIDPDGDTLSYTAAGLPAGLSIDPDTGEIFGTIDNSASQLNGGVYSVTVTANDGEGGTVEDMFDITVTNPAPDAVNDSLTASEDAVLMDNVITGSDSDPDGDDLTVTQVNGAASNVGAPIAGSDGGLFTVDANGTYSFDPNGEFEGLDVGETATTQITYQLSDGEGGFDTATVTVTLQGANDAPGPVDPLNPNGPFDPQDYIPAQLGNDSEALTPFGAAPFFEDVDGEINFYSAAGLPSWLSLNPFSGIITGTPPADASQGGPNSDGIYPITITATDPDGESFSTLVDFIISNPAPDAMDDAEVTDEDTVISSNIFPDNGNGADIDIDGDALSVTQVNGTPITVGATITLPSGALLSINPDGSYDYDPNGQFEGLAVGEVASDSFAYTISDGEGGTDTATVSFTIEGVNDAPIPVDPSEPTGPIDSQDYIPAQSGEDGTAVTALDLTPFFGDPDGSDTLVISVDPAALPEGLVFDAATGIISGTPSADASQGGADGVYIIAVTASDPSGESFTTNVSYTITNPPPLAQNDGQSGDENSPVSFSLFADNSMGADVDPDGDVIFVTRVLGVADETALASAADGTGVSTAVAGTNGGLFTVAPDGTVSFDTNADFEDLAAGESRITQIVYQIDDGQGGTDRAIATYTVSGVNDAPIPVDPSQPEGPIDPLNYILAQSGDDSSPVTALDLTPFFGDPDGSDTLVISLDPAALPEGLVFDAATNTISGTPSADASQGGADGVYTIPVTATDSSGASFTTNVTYTLSNPAPIAENDSYEVAEDGALSVNILTENDSDPDGDALTIDMVALVDGTIVPVGTPTEIAEGTLTVNADGRTEFEPRLNFFGPVTFGYTLSDGQGGTDVATVTITVTAVNDAPIPVDPSQPELGPENAETPVDPENPHEPPFDPSNFIPEQSGTDNAALTQLDLSVFFGDPDPMEELAISVDPAQLPEGLSFDPETGILSGTPSSDASQGGPNADGVYTIAVTATDPDGASFTTNVTYVITNPAPIATGDGVLEIVEDTPTVITLLGNDNDPDGDDITITEINGAPITVGTPVELPSGAQLTLAADGSLTYLPAAEFNGPDSFDYTIDDGQGGTDSAQVSLNVTLVNDAPIVTPAIDGEPALPARNSLDGETITPVDVSGPFSDIDGDTLSFTATGLPEGLMIDPETGVITGTLTASASADGPYNVTITASDADGASVSTEIVWTVENVTPTVIAELPNVSFDDASNVNLPIAASFEDPDGDALTYTATGLPEGLMIDPETGLISGTIDNSASQAGPYDITISAVDAQGGTVSSTFTMTVNNVAPVIETGEGPNGGNASLGEGGAALIERMAGLGEPLTIDLGSLTSDLDGDDGLSFTVTELPAGLSLDPETGIVSGAPILPQAEPFEFTITVDDGEGGTAQVTVLLTVLEDGFIAPDDVSFDPLVDGVDPYAFLEGEPIELTRYFHERALENADSFGRMFGDRDFRGAMLASPISGMGEACAYLVAEAVAHEHNINLQLSSTLDSFCGIEAKSWTVEMANGAPLPDWVDWSQGSDFVVIHQPLEIESLTLRIRALLDNGLAASMSVEIDLGSGNLVQAGEAISQAQTLSEQLILENIRLSTGPDALIKSLVS